MSSSAQPTAPGNPAPTSCAAKLLNVLVTPSLVFEEVALGAPNPVNWLAPTILVCLTSLLLLNLTMDPGQGTSGSQQLLASGGITQEQAAVLSAHTRILTRLALCAGVFLGVFWAALVLWFIGRVLLNGRFGFGKALEVAGLSGTILALGTVVTWLLILATSNGLARPALSLVFLKLESANRLRSAAGVLNAFYLWAAAVLSIGLSRLSGAGVKEAGFWVFGFWIVGRLALLLLS